jgi:hypothetical protein
MLIPVQSLNSGRISLHWGSWKLREVYWFNPHDNVKFSEGFRPYGKHHNWSCVPVTRVNLLIPTCPIVGTFTALERTNKKFWEYIRGELGIKEAKYLCRKKLGRLIHVMCTRQCGKVVGVSWIRRIRPTGGRARYQLLWFSMIPAHINKMLN